VVVRQDVAVGRHHDAGSEAALSLRTRHDAPPGLVVVIAEEASEEVVTALELRWRRSGLALDSNRDNGRCNGLDDVGVRVARAGCQCSTGYGWCLCARHRWVWRRSRGEAAPGGAADQGGCCHGRSGGAEVETSGVHSWWSFLKSVSPD
jgi:hypothetical protein